MKVLREGNPDNYKKMYSRVVTCLWCASQLQYGYDDIMLSFHTWLHMTDGRNNPPGEMIVRKDEGPTTFFPEFHIICPRCNKPIMVEVEEPHFAWEIAFRYSRENTYPKLPVVAE